MGSIASAHGISARQLAWFNPKVEKLKSGKVREIFDLGDAFLLVATDRISAFDCVMPNGIPRKGEVLTQISHFWFEKFAALVPNHLLLRANERLGLNRPAAAEFTEPRSPAQVSRRPRNLLVPPIHGVCCGCM